MELSDRELCSVMKLLVGEQEEEGHFESADLWHKLRGHMPEGWYDPNLIDLLEANGLIQAIREKGAARGISSITQDGYEFVDHCGEAR